MDPLSEVATVTTVGDGTLAGCTQDYLNVFPFLKTPEGGRFCRMLNQATPEKIAQYHCERHDFPQIYLDYRESLRAQPNGTESVGLLNEVIDKIYVWLQSDFRIDPGDFIGVGSYRIGSADADVGDPHSLGNGWISLGGLFVHTLKERKKAEIEQGRKGVGMGQVDEIIGRLRTTDTYSARSVHYGSSSDYACMLGKLDQIADSSFSYRRANLKILSVDNCKAFARDFSYSKYIKIQVWKDMYDLDPEIFRSAAFEMVALQKHAGDFEEMLEQEAGNWVVLDDDAEFVPSMDRVRETLDRAHRHMEDGIRWVAEELANIGAPDRFDDPRWILSRGIERLYGDPASVYSCRPVPP